MVGRADAQGSSEAMPRKGLDGAACGDCRREAGVASCRLDIRSHLSCRGAGTAQGRPCSWTAALVGEGIAGVGSAVVPTAPMAQVPGPSVSSRIEFPGAGPPSAGSSSPGCGSRDTPFYPFRERPRCTNWGLAVHA